MQNALFVVCFAAFAAGCGTGEVEAVADPDPDFDIIGSVDCERRAPFFVARTFQPASAAIGQPDLTSDGINRASEGIGPPAANSLTVVQGLSCGSLWAADPFNGRVLRFPTPGDASTSATLVLGQDRFDAPMTGGTTGARMKLPGGVHEREGKVFVCDTGNHRVLIWNTRLLLNGAGANVVLGQPDFTSGGEPAKTSESSLLAPKRAMVVDGKLLVSEGQNRILVWSAIPTLNGEGADMVIGQPDFTTSESDVTSGATLDGPVGMWSDGTRLVVADSRNHRVLIWTSFPTANGQSADLVLGQTDMESTAPGLGPSGMHRPVGVESTGNQLIVSDQLNHRVLIWNTFPTQNGQAADVVLGQGDFNHGAPNDANQDAEEDADPTARTMNFPDGVRIVGSQLYVADSNNHRVLVFGSGE